MRVEELLRLQGNSSFPDEEFYDVTMNNTQDNDFSEGSLLHLAYVFLTVLVFFIIWPLSEACYHHFKEIRQRDRDFMEWNRSDTSSRSQEQPTNNTNEVLTEEGPVPNENFSNEAHASRTQNSETDKSADFDWEDYTPNRDVLEYVRSLLTEQNINALAEELAERNSTASTSSRNHPEKKFYIPNDSSNTSSSSEEQLTQTNKNRDFTEGDVVSNENFSKESYLKTIRHVASYVEAQLSQTENSETDKSVDSDCKGDHSPHPDASEYVRSLLTERNINALARVSKRSPTESTSFGSHREEKFYFQIHSSDTSSSSEKPPTNNTNRDFIEDAISNENFSIESLLYTARYVSSCIQTLLSSTQNSATEDRSCKRLHPHASSTKDSQISLSETDVSSLSLPKDDCASTSDCKSYSDKTLLVDDISETHLETTKSSLSEKDDSKICFSEGGVLYVPSTVGSGRIAYAPARGVPTSILPDCRTSKELASHICDSLQNADVKNESSESIFTISSIESACSEKPTLEMELSHTSSHQDLILRTSSRPSSSVIKYTKPSNDESSSDSENFKESM